MAERVLVTGADGFVGRCVCRKLIQSGFIPRAGLRSPELWPQLQRSVPGMDEFSIMGDLSADPNLRGSFADVSVVLHLAARVHVMRDTAADPASEFRYVNVEGTKSIARAAVEAGVRRLIFVSTIKVHGESTDEKPFTENMPCNPQDAYAVSKLEAEETLRSISAESGLQVVIVRPPLIYGPRVRGNFLRLMRLVDRGIPLPFSENGSRRSLLGVENLADFLVHCIHRPEAANQSFLVKDSEDVSTRELSARLAHVLGRRIQFLPIPESLMRFAAKLARKEAAAGRLLNSLTIDSGKARKMLEWVAPVTLDEGLAATVRWYRESGQPRQGVAL